MFPVCMDLPSAVFFLCLFGLPDVVATGYFGSYLGITRSKKKKTMEKFYIGKKFAIRVSRVAEWAIPRFQMQSLGVITTEPTHWSAVESLKMSTILSCDAAPSKHITVPRTSLALIKHWLN